MEEEAAGVEAGSEGVDVEGVDPSSVDCDELIVDVAFSFPFFLVMIECMPEECLMSVLSLLVS